MARRLGMARRQGQALLGVPNADHQRRHDRAATLVGPASGGPPAGPRDALVAGFDDIPAASWAAYDLATFVQDGARMVDEAMAILSVSAESHKPVGDVRVIVPAKLVERGTTRR